MKNIIFYELVHDVALLLGAPKEHASGSGVRFSKSSKGKATIYHSNISAGNFAEIAIDPVSNAARLGISVAQMNERVRHARISTGRDVGANTQYNWPRIGVAVHNHIADVIRALAAPEE